MPSNKMIATILAALMFGLALSQNNGLFYGNFVYKDTKQHVNLLPPARNQNQPRPCDASWAFAITSAMATQFNLKKFGSFPEIVLSPQMLINCAPEEVPFDCTYNSSPVVLEPILDFVKANGVSDESCNNYHASDKKTCSKADQCQDCHNGEDIFKEPVCEAIDYRAYKLESYKKLVSNNPDQAAKYQDISNQIINEIKSNGPVICRINHSDRLFKFRVNKMEVFVDASDVKRPYSTWVSVVGYQLAAKGQPATLVLQHSFGENVGHSGVISIKNDKPEDNYLEIFDSCYSLTVQAIPTLVRNSASSVYASIFSDKGVKTTHTSSAATKQLNQGLKLSFTNKPFEQIALSGSSDPIPEIDWREKDKVNYLTYVKNQHIPVYCGSCWAQAAASVLADRANIQKLQQNKPFPKRNLSVQAIINCKVGGSCFGGDSTLLFQKGQDWRIPVETCQTYQSRNPESFDCDPKLVCSGMSSNPDQPIIYKNYAGFRVTDWKRVRGAANIKQALQTGPIVCDFQVNQEFVKYKKEEKLNIWTKNFDYLEINHAVSVVGWGRLGDTEYWIVRNSWGREWGYDGFFYIKAGENILGIESECSYADPIFEDFDLSADN